MSMQELCLKVLGLYTENSDEVSEERGALTTTTAMLGEGPDDYLPFVLGEAAENPVITTSDFEVGNLIDGPNPFEGYVIDANGVHRGVGVNRSLPPSSGNPIWIDSGSGPFNEREKRSGWNRA